MLGAISPHAMSHLVPKLGDRRESEYLPGRKMWFTCINAKMNLWTSRTLTPLDLEKLQAGESLNE